MTAKHFRPWSKATLTLMVLWWACVASTAFAAARDRTDPIPKRAQSIDVIEHLGARVPGDLAFVDQDGRNIQLGEALGTGTPTVVTMNYSTCPMLCSLQLDALVRTLKQTRQTMGKDYRIVTISYDPTDTPERLHRMRARYLGDYGRAEGERPWTMLSGNANNVRAAADALGIKYTYNEERKEYLHPAVVVLTTPDLRISRYLYGLEHDSKTLGWSMLEASNGRTIRSIDRLLLFCFHYDSDEGRYAPVALNIMRVGASITVVLLGTVLSAFWWFESRQRKRLLEVPPC